MRAERGTRTKGAGWREEDVSPQSSVRSPQSFRRARWPLCASLTLVLLATALVALAWGSVPIPPTTIARMVLARLHLPGANGTAPANWPASYETIIFSIRLPRVILAGLVGAALALSGATYQGLFRNPLADPYLIG